MMSFEPFSFYSKFFFFFLTFTSSFWVSFNSSSFTNEVNTVVQKQKGVGNIRYRLIGYDVCVL